MKYPLLFYNGKRPDNSGDLIKKELINYIQEESKKNHFPSRRELEKRFHLRLNNICGSIYNLYGLAQLTYFQVQNQEIKSKKANLLLEIVLENLEKFGLNLVKCRRVAERGIDILALEKGKLVGIELKAYNAKEKLKARDILQTERFITEEHLYKAILITSTDLKDNNLPLTSTIKLVYYTELCNLITPNQIEKLEYIRNHSINIITESKEKNKQKILDYVKQQYDSAGKKVTCQEISLNLHLDVRTYFNRSVDIYKSLQIPPPTKGRWGARAQTPDKEFLQLWKNKFKEFILEEVKNGRYPSGVEIGTHFSISHIWNLVKTSELYNELGIAPYRERSKRRLTNPLIF